MGRWPTVASSATRMRNVFIARVRCVKRCVHGRDDFKSACQSGGLVLEMTEPRVLICKCVRVWFVIRPTRSLEISRLYTSYALVFSLYAAAARFCTYQNVNKARTLARAHSTGDRERRYRAHLVRKLVVAHFMDSDTDIQNSLLKSYGGLFTFRV